MRVILTHTFVNYYHASKEVVVDMKKNIFIYFNNSMKYVTGLSVPTIGLKIDFRK